LITVYDHPLSPYSQKVKIALLEKGLEFESPMPGDLGSGQTAGEFAIANPRGEVPALIHEDVSIFDSSIILEYIEDNWPEPALLPDTAAERARVRMLEDVMDTHYEAINWGLAEIVHFQRAEGEIAEQFKVRAGEQISNWQDWLEGQLSAREYFNGSNFGWADLSIVPYINGSAGFGFMPKADSRLADWLLKVNERESVKTVTEAAAAMSMEGNAAGMAAVKQALDAGLFKREYRDHRLEWMIKTGGIDIVRDGLAKENIRFTDEFHRLKGE
jgi:glutathione S-transferase